MILPEQKVFGDMARYCAAWWHALERCHPGRPGKQKEAIMHAYFEDVLASEETGALIGTMGLRGV